MNTAAAYKHEDTAPLPNATRQRIVVSWLAANDEVGNIKFKTDANGNTTSYEYDALNRQTAMTYADGARVAFGYDENGNRTSLTDAKGLSFSYAFDALNRNTQMNYPLPAAPTGGDLQSIANSFDANGNLIQVTEAYSGTGGTRTTQRSFDAFDRLTSVTDGFNKTLGYLYDPNGNRTALTDPDKNVTRYTYDALNRVATVTNSGGITTYAYDRSSLKTKVVYPNGTTAETTYDHAKRILTLVNRQGAAPVSSYSYRYDANGNRTQQIENVTGTDELTSYTYDDNDRLDSVAYPDKQTAYSFDANANRLTEVTTANNVIVLNKRYTYNTRNQLTGIGDSVTPANDAVYDFDANGNEIRKTQGGNVTDFSYDVKDQLIAVRQNAANTGVFAYDYQGHRIVKDMGGAIVRYAYDGNSVLVETDTSGTTVAKFDYGPDRLLSMNHIAEGRAYYLFDALGSVANLVTGAGAIQARYQYDAFGNYRSQAGSSFNRFAFTGHEKDNETNLYYFKARYYDPDTGRFLTQDAYLGDINTPPSLHRYLYAYSNPLVYHDPSGHITALVDAEDKIDEFGKQSVETAKDIAGAMKDAPWYAKPYLAIGWATAGAGYLGSKAAGAVVAGANMGANAYVIATDKIGKAVGTESALSGLAREAETEIGATVEKAAPAIDAFKQDARGTAGKVVVGTVTAIGAQIKSAANGDSQAIFDLASNINPRQMLKNIRADVVHMVEKKSVTAEASVVKVEERSVAQVEGARVEQDVVAEKPVVPGPGEDLYVGSYNKSYRANVKTGLQDTHTPHHAVQDAVSSTTHGKGVTINIRKDIHVNTRSYSKNVDLGWPRANLAADVRDLRQLLGQEGYDPALVRQQLQELIRQNKAIGGFEK